MNNNTDLCDLFFKYGSDKCPQIFHSYSPVYQKILTPHKNNILSMIEIGIGNIYSMINTVGATYQAGASLKAWRDFLPNAIVYGLDIDRTILFEDTRIKCFYTNQSSEASLLETLENIKNYIYHHNYFDLIIDDGSHIIQHMILSLEVLKNYLNNNGLYIIEDIKKIEIDIFISLVKKYHDLTIEHIHYGKSDWDSFIIYKKIK
jgi:hypothetical protein